MRARPCSLPSRAPDEKAPTTRKTTFQGQASKEPVFRANYPGTTMATSTSSPRQSALEQIENEILIASHWTRYHMRKERRLSRRDSFLCTVLAVGSLAFLVLFLRNTENSILTLSSALISVSILLWSTSGWAKTAGLHAARRVEWENLRSSFDRLYQRVDQNQVGEQEASRQFHELLQRKLGLCFLPLNRPPKTTLVTNQSLIAFANSWARLTTESRDLLCGLVEIPAWDGLSTGEKRQTLFESFTLEQRDALWQALNETLAVLPSSPSIPRIEEAREILDEVYEDENL